MFVDVSKIKSSVRAWLEEDLGPGDVSSWSVLPEDHQSRAVIHVKEEGIAAGLPVAELVFREINPSLQVRRLAEEGAAVSKGDVLLEIEGSTGSILSGERLALNLLQRLSGIATKTRRFVDQVSDLPSPPRIVDTRKTTPGLRMLEKYAVRIGGGHNHRYGLFDCVMLKDNHIKAAGGITQAIARSRAHIPHTMKIEVEVETLEQAAEAAKAGADLIMLDNMDVETMKEAVQLIRAAAPQIVIEASGGITLDTVRAAAETGVDVISVGELTHSVSSLDISLDLNEKKVVRP
jgi:nicotinate-nucleotide pyrophosphorylase (carboxylating)